MTPSRPRRQGEHEPPRGAYCVEWPGGGRRSTESGREAYAGGYPIPGTTSPREPERYRAFTPPPGRGYGTPSGASHGYVPHRFPEVAPFGSSFAVGPASWRVEPSYAGRAPRNSRRSDDRIREDVCEALTEDAFVDASDVEVSVADGVVTLSGAVATRDQKRDAEEISERCRGVRDVRNAIRVRTPSDVESPPGATS
jgi:hypothetical protein